MNAKTKGQKRKIAVFLPTLMGGGAERVMVNIARGFVERDIEVDLVVGKKDGPCLAHVPKEVSVIDLGGKRVLHCLPALTSYLWKEKPTVMLSALDHANLASLIARSFCGGSTRMVLTLHNTIPDTFPLKKRLYSLFLFHALRQYLRPNDHLVAVSNGVADSYFQRTALAGLPIEVIYNPVISEDLYIKAERNLTEWKPPEEPYFVGIGRLHEQKDFFTLIKAFRLARNRYPAKLVILGEGDLRPDLERLIEEQGMGEDVFMPGFIPNPYPVLKRAAAFVLSSRREGLPTVLIEALALGVPVVSTNCRSGPEEILMGGKFGTLVPVGDIDGLANAMINKIRENRNSLQKDAIRRFEQDWSVDQYLQLVQEATP